MDHGADRAVGPGAKVMDLDGWGKGRDGTRGSGRDRWGNGRTQGARAEAGEARADTGGMRAETGSMMAAKALNLF